MNNNRGLKNIIWVVGAAMIAQTIVATTSAVNDATIPEIDSSIIEREESEIPFSEMIVPETESDYPKPFILTRAYGDSIVLRWATNSYVDWLYLRTKGVTISRLTHTKEGLRMDTIVRCLKPLSYDEFRKVYPDTVDSLAYGAMGVLYGKNNMTEEQTDYEPGTPGSMMDLYEEQKLKLAYGLLFAEWRPDLADAMALRYVDKSVTKGGEYYYTVGPAEIDTTGRFKLTHEVSELVKNEKYKPEEYDLDLKYEITGQGAATFTWKDMKHSSFEIYRRKKGETDWTKCNENPYMPQYQGEMDNQIINYSDKAETIGEYEYSIAAHDAFGDLTEKCKPVKVVYPDVMPPVGPDITRIMIDRPGENDYDSIFARIYFRKDTMEADFVRYVPMYYNERDSLKEWRLLTNKYIAPTDTMVRVDVTNLSTGMVTIAAVDTANNMGYAFPRLLRIQDMRPPKRPKNIRAVPDLDGTIFIHWEQEDSIDVRQYQVFFANSLANHSFMIVNRGELRDTYYIDTVSTNANERYIYYCVRPIDFEGNQGPMSDTIRVLRPNPEPPTIAHLDSAWVDSEGIHSRWYGGADAMIRDYVVYHKLENQRDWDTLAIYNGDDVKANGYLIPVDHKPEINRLYRHQYAIETVSFWNISSGLSLTYSDWFVGDTYLKIPIKLYGRFDEKTGETRLAWEAKNIPQGDYRFCVFQKTKYDKTFQYLIDEPINASAHTNRLLPPGETAEYYVMIYYPDGRESFPSNVVTITAPEKKPDEKK